MNNMQGPGSEHCKSEILNPQSTIKKVVSWSFCNGQFVAADSVPLTDRGFRYGMHVFETIAVVRGQLLLKECHFQRLNAAAGQMRLHFPATFDREFVSLEELLAEKTGIVRCFLTAGDGVPGSVAGEGRFFVCFDELEVQPVHDLLRLIEASSYMPEFPVRVKSGNYWFNNIQLEHAREKGYDNVLLFNSAGELASAATANVFLWFDGRWATPPVTSGCRAGCVREWVLERFACEEILMTRSDISRAEAIFLTNSRIGLAAVGELSLRQMAIPKSFFEMRDAYWKEVARVS